MTLQRTTEISDNSDDQTSEPHATLDMEQRSRIHSLLFGWYTLEGRHHLPWRHTRDPYAVLVSEMMLQQTQVERVLPKYISFLAQFPSLAALADAPTAEVIKSWAGLGYNMRAVRLQEIARQAVARYSSTLPASFAELLTLKGIGRYTAGAIACFAFELPVATVDTNIRRVLWRVFRGIEPGVWPADERATRASFALAEWALPAEHAYDWQQALMDLGATICLSRRPLCERCPLAQDCAAYRETAAVALFPSGEALVRLRDERMLLQHAADATNRDASEKTVGTLDARRKGQPPQRRKIAEAAAGYDAHSSNGSAGKGTGKTSGKKREPFEQSSRYFRGRVVEALRTLAADETLTLAALGPLVRPDFTADDPEQVRWLYGVVRGLAHDGLARFVTPEESAEGTAASAPVEITDLTMLHVALP